MPQSSNDEEKKTLQKRQRKQEDTIMRGSINPQQVAKLPKKQQQSQRQKENSYLLNLIRDY